jgi:hypothetical protein
MSGPIEKLTCPRCRSEFHFSGRFVGLQFFSDHDLDLLANMIDNFCDSYDGPGLDVLQAYQQIEDPARAEIKRRKQEGRKEDEE